MKEEKTLRHLFVALVSILNFCQNNWVRRWARSMAGAGQGSFFLFLLWLTKIEQAAGSFNTLPLYASSRPPRRCANPISPLKFSFVTLATKHLHWNWVLFITFPCHFSHTISVCCCWHYSLPIRALPPLQPTW